MRTEVLAVAGSGPPLVYVPGIDGSGEMLLGLARRLEEHFTLTRLRYEGGGPGDYAELARGVAAAIEGTGTRHALVLAESFGVAVALRTALEHPEQVAGLALVNGFARFDDRLSLAATRGFFALAPEAWISRARGRFAQRGLISPRRDEAVLRDLAAQSGDWFGAGYRARLAMIRNLDLRPRLGEIRCPVAIWAADKDRVVDAVPAGRVMQQGIADATLEVLPRAGHLVLPLSEEPWERRLVELAGRCGVRA